MSGADLPELLFFDTFSHDSSEELNLDLVQFPKSVFVREVRIIPLGARVEGEFPGGVRLGATNPSKFTVDLFVNDLSKPGASTFEGLGSIDYCQNGTIHMECSPEQPRIPTDGLVLRGCYTTITLAVYGNLTQATPEVAVGSSNPIVPRQAIPITRDVTSITSVPPPGWSEDAPNAIPTYTGAVAAANPDAYGPYPENYESQVYRPDYYPSEPPKDPRTYHHLDEAEWEKRSVSVEREGGIHLSPRSLELDRDRRERVRGLSVDRRSREPSRIRDRSRELDRLRSRSRDRDYVVKGEYRSRSRSLDRRMSTDRDWDRGSYKKDDYRRRRDSSYDRSRGGSYERRSPYEKRASSYDRKIPYEKRGPSFERREPSYERRAPSYEKTTTYDRKRHSPYNRLRTSSYGSVSPGRDDPRKRPRSPPRPLSPREGETSSPITSARSEEAADYDRNLKQIPRVEFYHQTYRHKNSIRSPSQEVEVPPFVEPQHSSLVTVHIVDTPTPVAPAQIESPPRNPDDDRSMDAEQFEPILSDEDICDDLEGQSYIDADYDVNDYVVLDDVIKYYNPFKLEWNKYEHINQICLLPNGKTEGVEHVLNTMFEELCEASPDLFKILELTKANMKREQKFTTDTFVEIDNSAREDWVHQCEQLFVTLTNLCKNTDIILRIFKENRSAGQDDGFRDIYDFVVTFCKIGLKFDFALAQNQPTYKIRHMKCGIRFAEALMSHKHSGRIMTVLLNEGINMPMLLLEMYAKEYMALSIRLMILKALNACLSSKQAMDQFMKETVFPTFTKNVKDEVKKPMNGYQALITIMQTNPLVRIKFSISALIKKCNMYELLGKLHNLVLDFNQKAAENTQAEDAELSASDTEFIVDAFSEILNMYRAQSFHLSQPKRFLPVSAQFDINKESCNEILLKFFNIHHTLESCLYLLTCPTTCNNLVVISPIHDLIHELINSYNGILFLYENMELSELLFKSMMQPYGQNEDFIYPHDLTNYSDLQILGLDMAYRLKAVYYLQSIGDLQPGAGDENELIDRLQDLYCLSFGSIGRMAVPDVIVMGNHADCLMKVFENSLKSKDKAESLTKQKSPAKGYAIELIVSAVRFSANVPFLKKYAQRLINVSKEHDKFEPSVSSVLQEVIPYLKPVEKNGLLNGDDLAECVEILKTSIEHSADMPGELTTCLRILRHFCISDYDSNIAIACESSTEEYAELKYKYNVLQLFSLDGVAHLSGILDKLATHFDQPSMHTSTFASVKGLQLAQIILPCLRLLDEMLARVVRCRGPRFRDLTAAPVLLKTYGIVKAFPVGCVGYRTAAKAAEASVRALLAYAQPIADDATSGDSIRRGPWTSLCSEVISYTMTAPYTFVSGLLVFSELLPLPLPMQTKVAPTERELEDASNERRLWSAHLHSLSNELTDMIQIICMSTYRPVVHMLRRVCVQIADLAPNTAATVAKAAVGAVMNELKPGEPADASSARVLGFLACLVSHAPVKCAVIYTISSGGPSCLDVQNALCGVLSVSNPSNEHAAAQEFVAHILAALCDAEVSLTPPTGPLDQVIANSLPSKDSLAVFLDATADCLASPAKTCAVTSAILRAYFVLTEHEYGFQQFKKFVTKRRESLGKFFRWALEAQGDDRLECLNLYIDLIRILRADEGEGPCGRRSILSVEEIADMVHYCPGDQDHPAIMLETILKERNCDEDVIANAVFLTGALCGLRVGAAPPEEGVPVGAAPPLPLPLTAQFAARAVYSTTECAERLSAAYWLSVPTHDVDPAYDHVVSCDVLEIANTFLGSGTEGARGGEALVGAVRKLAGCMDTRGLTDKGPRTDNVRPAVLVPRGIARSADGAGGGAGAGGADAFRSRPPNTSRPPSLHVDDFTALHVYHPHLRGMRRGGAGGAGGRGFSPAHPHSHPHPPYRNMRGRGAWEGGQHFGHFAPHYAMGGMGWGRLQRGPRHRNFMR